MINPVARMPSTQLFRQLSEQRSELEGEIQEHLRRPRTPENLSRSEELKCRALDIDDALYFIANSKGQMGMELWREAKSVEDDYTTHSAKISKCAEWGDWSLTKGTKWSILAIVTTGGLSIAFDWPSPLTNAVAHIIAIGCGLNIAVGLGLGSLASFFSHKDVPMAARGFLNTLANEFNYCPRERTTIHHQ